MMRTLKHTTVLVAAALFAAACSRDRTETPLPPRSDVPIYWDVKAEGSAAHGTRALIGNDPAPGGPAAPDDPTEADYYLPLSKSCTPEKEGGPGFAVGLFGDYTYQEGGNWVTVYDLFRGTRLVYSGEEGDNPHSSWNYELKDNESDKKYYWHPGAQYTFRAYYPQKIYNYTVSTSNATTLAIVYPTRKLQYDLLLGCTQVTATSETMKQALEIELEHALAALRFEFKLGFEDEDWLTSCFLLNDEERHFCTQGTVVYGSAADPESETWLHDYNPPATEELYKWVPPAKYWKTEHAEDIDKLPKEGSPIYMKSTPVNTASAGTIQYESIKATAYTYGKGGSKEDVTMGALHCRNSGWVRIVPQESYGKLSLCFTTKKGGDSYYQVTLPAATEYDKDGNAVSTEWKKGKRYTYTVTLSKSDLDIDVQIEPWNQRKHSTEIVF